MKTYALGGGCYLRRYGIVPVVGVQDLGAANTLHYMRSQSEGFKGLV
jgi:hypothetical protein